MRGARNGQAKSMQDFSIIYLAQSDKKLHPPPWRSFRSPHVMPMGKEKGLRRTRSGLGELVRANQWKEAIWGIPTMCSEVRLFAEHIGSPTLTAVFKGSAKTLADYYHEFHKNVVY